MKASDRTFLKKMTRKRNLLTNVGGVFANVQEVKHANVNVLNTLIGNAKRERKDLMKVTRMTRIVLTNSPKLLSRCMEFVSILQIFKVGSIVIRSF